MAPLFLCLHMLTMALSTDRIVQLNHAGASPSPISVSKRVQEHALFEQAVGGYAAQNEVANELLTVYESVATLVQAKDPTNEIALVESATVAWTRLFYAFCQHLLGTMTTTREKQAVIWISEAEYAANVVAACHWARTHPGWTVRILPSTKDSVTGKSNSKVDVVRFAEILDGPLADQAALVCVTHIPTNSGIVNPVEEIGSLVAKHNEKHQSSRLDGMPSIWYLVDACQSVGQREINVQQIQCHGLVATGRKYLRAPRGTGFLYCPQHVANKIWPSHVDHYGVPIQTVPSPIGDEDDAVEDFLEFSPRPGARRFEFWESNIGNKLGLGQAVRVALEENVSRIAASIQILAVELDQRLSEMKGVRLYREPECGLVTFWVEGIDSGWIKNQLWERDEDGTRVEVSVVPATSTPLDSAQSGATDLLRASISYTNSIGDIVLLCSRLSSILRQLKLTVE